MIRLCVWRRALRVLDVLISELRATQRPLPVPSFQSRPNTASRDRIASDPTLPCKTGDAGPRAGFQVRRSFAALSPLGDLRFSRELRCSAPRWPAGSAEQAIVEGEYDIINGNHTVRINQIVGVSSWAKSESYDIEAKVDAITAEAWKNLTNVERWKQFTRNSVNERLWAVDASRESFCKAILKSPDSTARCRSVHLIVLRATRLT